jgi:hypothetical protein
MLIDVFAFYGTVQSTVEYYSISHPQASMSDVMIETRAKIQYIVYCIFLPYTYSCTYIYRTVYVSCGYTHSVFAPVRQYVGNPRLSIRLDVPNGT